MELTINVAQDAQVQTLSIMGEVDVSNASVLRETVDGALAQGPSQIDIDLSQVPYIDSTGIGVLVGAAHRAAEQGVGLAVTHPQRNVARVLSLLGVAAELNVSDRAGAPADDAN